MPGPFVEPFKLPHYLGEAVRIWVEHSALGSPFTIDTQHCPTASKELLKKQRVVASVFEPDQLKVAREWMYSMNATPTVLLAKVPAMMAFDFLLEIAEHGDRSSVELDHSGG